MSFQERNTRMKFKKTSGKYTFSKTFLNDKYMLNLKYFYYD